MLKVFIQTLLISCFWLPISGYRYDQNDDFRRDQTGRFLAAIIGEMMSEIVQEMMISETGSINLDISNLKLLMYDDLI